MASYENLPFERGGTFNGGGPSATVGATEGQNLEGQEFVTRDEDWAGSPLTPLSGHPVRLKVVRNAASFNLLPRRLVQFKAGDKGKVDGYVRITGGEVAGVVDEYLPAGGVAANDVFYIVVGGPTKVVTALANLSADVTAGSKLFGATAVTSGATTAGRVTNRALSSTTYNSTEMEFNDRVIRGKHFTLLDGQAATTANTNTELRVYVENGQGLFS